MTTRKIKNDANENPSLLKGNSETFKPETNTNPEETRTMEDNIISRYTRKQAIKDGVLVDISNTEEAKNAGFKISVCITAHLWKKINHPALDHNLWRGRLGYVCCLAEFTFKMKLQDISEPSDSALVPFHVDFKEDKANTELWLCFTSHEGFTIMFPEDY